MSNVRRIATVDHRTVEAAPLVAASTFAHSVQFYDDEEFLFDTVASFVRTGVARGDRLLIIATKEHREGFTRHLRSQGIDAGGVIWLDARETLATFMVDDMPEPALFREVVGRAIGQAKAGSATAHVRAFGEMVDLLWREGNSRAAIRLEELWNEAGNDHALSLLCAYVMGNFYKEGDAAHFMEVCRTHSHVLPTESFSQLDDANARLREISLLQQRARSLEAEIGHRRELEAALRDALLERSRVEEELRACVVREQEARARAEANDAFKEEFLAILGHDLRNPLNTVLVTAQLMTMRGDLPPDNQKRMDRVVASGIRMQRMIEQLLDVTNARLGDGIPVVPSPNEKDLVPIVAGVVDEVRAAHPTRAIELVAPHPAMLRVDTDRFEQVVSNLVGNAVTHGSIETPVRVEVSATEDVVTFRVHNEGKPIDPAFMPRLFDPFKRAGQPRQRPAGLGLGLYISESIIRSHGGTIEVDSSVESGTTFDVVIPRRRS